MSTSKGKPDLLKQITVHNLLYKKMFQAYTLNKIFIILNPIYFFLLNNRFYNLSKKYVNTEYKLRDRNKQLTHHHLYIPSHLYFIILIVDCEICF